MSDVWTPTHQSNVTEGSVVVRDPDNDLSVKTSTTENDPTVAGVALEAKTAGNSGMVLSMGFRRIVNVTGSPTRGQWLYQSTSAGLAKGASTFQPGCFGYCMTDEGTPAAGQVYAYVNVGLSLAAAIVGALGLTGNLTITGILALTGALTHAGAYSGTGNLTLDAGTGDSPIITLTDVDDKTLTFQKFDAGHAVIANNEGSIRFYVSGNSTQYPILKTVGGVPELTTGAGNLKISSFTGTVDLTTMILSLTSGKIYIPSAADTSTYIASGSMSWNTTDKTLGVGDGTYRRKPGQFTALDPPETLFASTANGNTPFSATISGAPTTTSVVYTGDSNETSLAFVAGTGRIVLRNTTRGTTRLVTSINTATNTITTVSSTDAWADTDAITAQATEIASFMKVDLTGTTIPSTAKYIYVRVRAMDDDVADMLVDVADVSATEVMRQRVRTQRAAGYSSDQSFWLKITSRQFLLYIGGCNTAVSGNLNITALGYIE